MIERSLLRTENRYGKIPGYFARQRLTFPDGSAEGPFSFRGSESGEAAFVSVCEDDAEPFGVWSMRRKEQHRVGDERRESYGKPFHGCYGVCGCGFVSLSDLRYDYWRVWGDAFPYPHGNTTFRVFKGEPSRLRMRRNDIALRRLHGTPASLYCTRRTHKRASGACFSASENS